MHTPTPSDPNLIRHSDPADVAEGIDRRGFLHCMAWVGTGVVWAMNGGVLASTRLGQSRREQLEAADFTFVQISDSHIGFSKGPYQDVVGTLRQTVDRINALPTQPDLLIHTGDLTHLADPKEFDTVAEVLKSVKTGHNLYVPGEHDIDVKQGAKRYLDRYGGKDTQGDGWHSFDHKGVHFIGLVNVINHSDTRGLGELGQAQLEWLEKDVEKLNAETPVVVYAHVPLWTVYEKWGWGTKDADVALGYLKKFGSVTVLNGHIHQALQKTEGKVTFHTARSTAFPQPEPGKAEKPGPVMNLAADKIKATLGLSSVNYVEHNSSLAIVDSTLE
ncbi:MAG: metallophosphoesterase [Tepidisphaera sp.]|nr:metallophosphoesterase [Tepidisphaera sp.]